MRIVMGGGSLNPESHRTPNPTELPTELRPRLSRGPTLGPTRVTVLAKQPAPLGDRRSGVGGFGQFVQPSAHDRQFLAQSLDLDPGTGQSHGEVQTQDDQAGLAEEEER